MLLLKELHVGKRLVGVHRVLLGVLAGLPLILREGGACDLDRHFFGLARILDSYWDLILLLQLLPQRFNCEIRTLN